MKPHLFEAFARMIESLPANGILLVAELQEQMIEDDWSQKRVLPVEDAVSILNFCRFLQAVAGNGGIFPTVLPFQHLPFYRKTVKRLMEAGELPLNADQQFEKTFLPFFPENHWLFMFGNEGVNGRIEGTPRTQMAA